MLTKTPWYVSYNCLFILAVKGISKGNSVFPAGVESQKKYKSFKSFEKELSIQYAGNNKYITKNK
jgi:hypothetical protein